MALRWRRTHKRGNLNLPTRRSGEPRQTDSGRQRVTGEGAPISNPAPGSSSPLAIQCVKPDRLSAGAWVRFASSFARTPSSSSAAPVIAAIALRLRVVSVEAPRTIGVAPRRSLEPRRVRQRMPWVFPAMTHGIRL